MEVMSAQNVVPYTGLPETTQSAAASMVAGKPSQSPEPGVHTATTGFGFDPSKADSQLTKLIQQISGSQYTVTFDRQPNAQLSWMNVVDKTTGKVVYEIPPEGLRKWMEKQTGGVAGLSIDSVR